MVARSLGPAGWSFAVLVRYLRRELGMAALEDTADQDRGARRANLITMYAGGVLKLFVCQMFRHIFQLNISVLKRLTIH